jgi:hypothetical protein
MEDYALMLTVLDVEEALQPAMVATRVIDRGLTRSGNFDETRPEDFYRLSLQAQHHNLVQPTWLQSAP